MRIFVSFGNSRDECILTSERDVNFLNACFLIKITDEGISITVKDLQSKKTFSPILFNEDGSSDNIAFKDVQLSKALLLMYVTEEGIVILVNAMH